MDKGMTYSAALQGKGGFSLAKKYIDLFTLGEDFRQGGGGGYGKRKGGYPAFILVERKDALQSGKK